MNKIILFFILLLSGGFATGQKNTFPKPDPAFFPIAVWAQNPANAAAYKKNGINLFISIHNGLDQKKMDYLRQANMKVICQQNSYGLTQLQEPLIYGWMHGDEPDNAKLNKETNKYEPCRDPALIITDYQEMRRKDFTRPVYLNLGRGVAYTQWVGRGACKGKTDMYKASHNGYLNGCDIASFDIYPVNSREPEVAGNLWYVAKGIDSLQEWSDYKKPVWCWIETTRISDKSARKPTPQEVKAQVWMALVHGAKGFGYFCHSFVGKTTDAALLQDTEMMQAVSAINAQVAALAPVLNSGDVPGFATVSSSYATVPVDFVVKKDKDAFYILAVGMRNGTTLATFSVPSGKQVEVLGENRYLKIQNRTFTDDFSPYGVHLYKIKR